MEVGELSGKWSHEMYYTDLAVSIWLADTYTELTLTQTSQTRELFNPEKTPIMPKWCLPEDQQEKNESRRFEWYYCRATSLSQPSRLWSKLTQAIKNKDMEAATEAKSAVENEQRALAHKRDELGVSFEPRFFKPLPNGRWVPKIQYAISIGLVDTL